MTLAKLLALAALVLADPTGDASGDGTLIAPTAPIYASSAIFDLHEVDVEGDESGTTVRVTLGAIENVAGLPEGFSGVIVDVYLDTAPEGAEATLDGPNMRMPDGRGWQYAIRISGDGAYAVADAERADAAAAALPGAPSAEENAGAAVAAETASEAGLDALGRVPLAIVRDGSTLSVRLPWAVEERFEVYAMTGVYDPFTPSGWRPLATTPSPWAFSGSEQVVPVVDLLAPDAAAQERALRSGVLPRPETRAGSTSWWLLLMALGVALAGVGLWFRRHVRPQEAAATVPGADGEATSDVAADLASDGVPDTAAALEPETDQDAASDVAADTPSDSISDTPSDTTPTASATVPESSAASGDDLPEVELPDAVEADRPSPEPVVGETTRARKLQVVLTEEAGSDSRTPDPEAGVRSPAPGPDGLTPTTGADGSTPTTGADGRTPAPGLDAETPTPDPDTSSIAEGASATAEFPPDDPFAGFLDDEPDEDDDIDEFDQGGPDGADGPGRAPGRERQDDHG